MASPREDAPPLAPPPGGRERGLRGYDAPRHIIEANLPNDAPSDLFHLAGCLPPMTLALENQSRLIQGYSDGESILTHYINHESCFFPFLVRRKWQSEREDKQTEVEHASASKSGGEDGDEMKVKKYTCC